MTTTVEQSFSALVVDDDPRWRALVSETLRDAGWQVAVAGEPPAALDGYRLAILDIVLGPTTAENRDGLMLLDRLTELGTRCVLLSGLGDADLPPQGKRHPNVLGLIRKDSFRREDFLTLIGQAGVFPAGSPQPAPGGKVLLVEDDARWRAIYDELLAEAGYSCDCAASYGEARGWLQRTVFRLAIVDLHLASSADRQENRDGFSFLRAARQRGVPAIVVSALGAPEDIDRAYDEFGAFAFVEKEHFDRRDFARRVAEAIESGKPHVPEAERGDGKPATAHAGKLTEREREVLALLTQGRTNRQIAGVLLITPNTVKKHVDHILQKLAVSNRAAAVAVALREGL